MLFRPTWRALSGQRKWWREGKPGYERASARRQVLERRRIEESQMMPPVEPSPEDACMLYRHLLKQGYATLKLTDKKYYQEKSVMVGKSYLRYVEGPQNGVIASNASLQMACAYTQPFTSSSSFGAKGSGYMGGRAVASQQPAQGRSQLTASIFVPSLEAVRVFSVRSGAVQHTLIPAGAKLPLEVTAISVVPRIMGSAHTLQQQQESMQEDGWMLLVGYNNGHVAVFSCGPTNNYGKPVCELYALGHKPSTNVLTLAVDSRRVTMCSAGQDTDVLMWDLTTQEAICRLRGHRGGVVSIAFAPTNDSLLVSGAADGLIKIWDMNVKQCVQTVVASDSQVTALLLDSAGRRLYCGLRENSIKVFNSEALGAAKNGTNSTTAPSLAATESETYLTEHGSIQRKVHKPITMMAFSTDSSFIAACTNKTVEVFRVHTQEDVKKKMLRKKKRRRTTEEGAEEEENEDPEEGARATANEEIVLIRTFFLDERVRSIAFVPRTSPKDIDVLHLAVTFHNNTVRTYTTSVTMSDLEGGATLTLTDLVQRHTLEHNGHQSDIRALTFVEDESALLSVSKEKVLLWNVSVKDEEDIVEDDRDYYDAKEANVERVNLRGAIVSASSVPLTDATCAAAISASLCCIGQEDGTVLLADVAAAQVVFSEPGIHPGGVKHVVKRPDDSGFTTVGVDRRLIVWTLGLLKDKSKSVTLLQSQEIELTESPLFVEYSRESKFVAVGLQNNNIQLFYGDTMKPFLSLFGHKLPPTSVAFSSDCTLVASVGTDKSLRFWGTDFGDCHRAIHAHDDYVTHVEFIHDTHYAVTSSLDGTVKIWDGDNWTMIQLFRVHQRGVWCTATTINGTCIATAGVDKCIRLFLRTQDIIFPEEEEERMAQEAMDEEAAQRTAMQKLDEQNAEVGLAGQKTSSTTEAAEKLMEALDLVSVELQRQANPQDGASQHPLFTAKNVWEYLWSVIESIRPSEIRHALLSLTSTHVDALLNNMELMLQNRAVLNYEIAAKLVVCLVAPVSGQQQTTAAIVGEVSEAEGARRLNSIRRLIAHGLDSTLERMDYNIAGLQFVRHHLQDTEKIRFFDRTKAQGHKKKYHSKVLN